MAEQGIPAVVQMFLRDSIQTYEQLEVLLLLRKNAGTAMSVDAVAKALNLPDSITHTALGELRDSRLVEAQAAFFIYQPGSEELREKIEGLAQAYADSRLELVRLMTSNAIERVRNQAIHTFADAFVLGKGKKDG